MIMNFEEAGHEQNLSRLSLDLKQSYSVSPRTLFVLHYSSQWLSLKYMYVGGFYEVVGAHV